MLQPAYSSTENRKKEQKKELWNTSMNTRDNSLKINLNEGRKIALTLFENFNSDKGIFGHDTMPEDFEPGWGSDLQTSKIERGSYDQLLFINT